MDLLQNIELLLANAGYSFDLKWLTIDFMTENV